MRVLGISAFYHDSAAALIAEGRVVAAAQEERFPQEVRCQLSARRRRVLPQGRRVALADVGYVAFYDKPFLKFERLLETYLTFSPSGVHVVPHGAAVMAAGKALPQIAACQRAQGAAASNRALRFSNRRASSRSNRMFASRLKEAEWRNHSRRRYAILLRNQTDEVFGIHTSPAFLALHHAPCLKDLPCRIARNQTFRPRWRNGQPCPRAAEPHISAPSAMLIMARG
jgi:hypothetical protein